MSELFEQQEQVVGGLSLHDAWMASQLSLEDVWLGYRRAGGARSPQQVRAILAGGTGADYDRNLLALCLNEHLLPSDRLRYRAGPD